MAARSSLLRRPTPGARPARRTSSVVAALPALASRLVRLARHGHPGRPLMDFALSPEQEALRDLARRILADHVTPERLALVEAEPDRFDRAAWEALAGARLLGTAIPEEFGGSCLGVLELCLVLEEVGRAVAPVPAWPTLVLGALPLARFGTRAQRAALLPGVASGEVVLTAALVEPGTDDPLQPSATARRDGTRWRLDGTKTCVPAAHLAARILVPARAADGDQPRAARSSRPRRRGRRGTARGRRRPRLAGRARDRGALRHAGRRDGPGAPHDGRVHGRPRAVRPADRVLPGGAPARRRRLHRRRGDPADDLAGGVAPRHRSPRDVRGRDREVLGVGGRASGRVRGTAPARRDRRRRRLPAAPLLSLVEADRADARVGHAAARAPGGRPGAMTDIVLGPVLSLYSVAFYRRVARQRLGRGLAYLVYLSSLYSAAIAIALLAFWLPAADRFVDWLAPNLPE